MAGKRYTKKIFDPDSSNPFEISRSKIDLFVECPRCFYLDRRLGVSRPGMPAFTLNSAVDHLLKKEFDVHRANAEPHPLMTLYGINAIPFAHKDMDTWRHNFTGVRYLYEPANLLVFGAVDDIWINDKKDLHIVDYKATSKDTKPNLDGRWQEGYKRQMEVYQWLMRNNGFPVSDTGYFVYVNGKRDAKAFDGKLEFDIDVIAYVGDGAWIERTLANIKDALMSDDLPPPGELCEHCPYREEAGKKLQEKHKENLKPKNVAIKF